MRLSRTFSHRSQRRSGPYRRRRRTAPAILLILMVAVLVGGVAPAARAAPVKISPGPVVVVGVPGLRWDDVSAAGTPNLWRLAARAGLGNISTYTVSGVTCPADGWLSISAGQRASLEAATPRICPLAPRPVRRGSGASVPSFASMRARNLHGKYGARLGALGQALHRAQAVTVAAGPGAALAAADETGSVDVYAPTPESLPAQDWASAGLVVVDIDDVQRAYTRAGSATISRPGRAAAVRQADQRLGRILAAVPATATLLVAGISDITSRNSLHLALSVPGRGYLTSASTRRQGLVTLTDLTATILSAARVAMPLGMVGRPWHSGAAPVSPAGAAHRLSGDNRAAEISRNAMTPFWTAFMTAQLLLYAGAALALRRTWRQTRRRRLLAATRLVALCGAAGPLATYLVNLLPWWNAPHPVTSMLVLVAVFDAAIAAAGLAGPWRRSVLAPGTIIAALTATIFAADVVSGAHLQQNSMTGYNPIIAGRFYGFANIAYAAYATAVLLSAAGLAHLLLRRGRRHAAVLAVAGLGAAAEVVTAWPDWGAKFGGTIALVPGVAVTALIVAGRRVSPLRLALSCATGAAVISTFAFVDYLRPASRRTHLGEFAGQVLDGQAGTVMRRKISAMLHSVGHSPQLTVLTAAALVFFWLVLIRPTPSRTGALTHAYQHAPPLRAGLIGAFTTAMIGFAVEDSGIAVPAIALALAVPSALAASVRALELHAPRQPAQARSADSDDPGRPPASCARQSADRQERPQTLS